MTGNFKTIGLLRFSVLTPTYYSERFKTLEETAAHLFSPERMALRFHLFENLCLPSLAKQTDPDFTAIVMTAESMPEVYLERLDTLLRALPNIRLRPVGTGNHYPMLRAAYNSVDCTGCSHRVMFRLDDDDALDRDFIARTKKLAGGLLTLHETPPPTIIAYNRGFYVRRAEGGNEVFDAVVLNGAQDPATAISLCAALRRNASLYHLPTMMLYAAGDEATAKAALERGAAAIAQANAPCGPSLGWLFEAVRRERRRRAAEHDLRTLCDLMGDARTGLWKRPAFDAHLARLANDHHSSGRPMSLAVLRVLPAHGAREPSAEAWRRGFSEIASLAARLMR